MYLIFKVRLHQNNPDILFCSALIHCDMMERIELRSPKIKSPPMSNIQPCLAKSSAFLSKSWSGGEVSWCLGQDPCISPGHVCQQCNNFSVTWLFFLRCFMALDSDKGAHFQKHYVLNTWSFGRVHQSLVLTCCSICARRASLV